VFHFKIFEQMKNIIFDLGNVIIDIDFDLTFREFSKLSTKYSWKEIRYFIKQKCIWEDYEKGITDDEKFRDNLRNELKIKASDAELDNAFCALLQNIQPERINLLQELSKSHHLFILSNTSNIHFQRVEKLLYESSDIKHFSEIFEKIFLSFEMGKLKPEVEIYQQVLKEAHLHSYETLFLDDMLTNLEAAATLGIHTKQIIPNKFTIIDFFNNNEI
jgi:glucose-1-phosphatase